MSRADHLQAMEPLLGYFEKTGLSYYIGGSLASSAYGMARATVDIDLIADIQQVHIEPLYVSLKSLYYISIEAMREAVANRASFNLIHLETMIKIDIFALKQEPYDQTAFQRKRQDTLAEESSRLFYLASPEDVILSKLRWYHQGGRVSDQQWKDIQGVLKVQGDRLDKTYLKRWACRLGLGDLLQQSFQRAGVHENP